MEGFGISHAPYDHTHHGMGTVKLSRAAPYDLTHHGSGPHSAMYDLEPYNCDPLRAVLFHMAVPHYSAPE